MLTGVQVPAASETRICHNLDCSWELLILCIIAVKLLINPTGSEVSFEETEMSCLHYSLINFFDLSTRTAISGLQRARIWPRLVRQWFIWPRWKENRAFLASVRQKIGLDRTAMCWLSLMIIPVLSKKTTTSNIMQSVDITSIAHRRGVQTFWSWNHFRLFKLTEDDLKRHLSAWILSINISCVRKQNEEKCKVFHCQFIQKQ